MSDYITPAATRREQQRSRQAAEHIGELSVLLRMTSLRIGELEKTCGDIWPVLPRYGNSSLTGEELAADLIAWRWMIERAEDLLRSEFTGEYQQALVNAGFGFYDEDGDGGDDDEDDDGGDDDEDDDAPDDTPDVGPSFVLVGTGSDSWTQEDRP